MSTRAKRRASITSEVAGLQERIRKSVVGLPTYVACRVHEENYAELSRLAPSVLLSRNACLDSEVVDEVDFFQDLPLLLVLLQRAAAISDAQVLTCDLRDLFEDAQEDQRPQAKKLRAQAESLGIDSLFPAEAETDQSNASLLSLLRLEAWITWFQLRALRRSLKELLSADGLINQTTPTTLPEVIRISDSAASRIRSRLTSSAADKSVYRKDNAMKLHGLQRQSTSSLPMTNEYLFHLDWKSHPMLSKAQKEADAQSEIAFFRECHKLAMSSPCGFTSPTSDPYTLLGAFVSSAHHHWTESIVSALTEQSLNDPVEETLQASLPERLSALTLPSMPSIFVEDSPFILRRPREQQKILLRLMRRVSADKSLTSSPEERAFWGLLGGNFEAATSLTCDSENIALSALVAMSRLLALTPLNSRVEDAGSKWRGSVASESGDEAAGLAKEAVSERLRNFAAVVHRAGAIEDCCVGIFKSLRNAYAPKSSLAFDCLALLAANDDTETRNMLNTTILSAVSVSSSTHPLMAMAAMEFLLAWTTAELDIASVSDSEGEGSEVPIPVSPSPLITSYVERFCELQELSVDEVEAQYTFVLESCKVASSGIREDCCARLLVCQIRRDGQEVIRRGRDVWQRGLSSASKNLIEGLARDFGDDLLRIFELATQTLLRQSQQVLESLCEASSITHEEILAAHTQALVCIQCIAFAAPDISAPLSEVADARETLRRLSETCSREREKGRETISYAPEQARLRFLSTMASLGTAMGLASDVFESLYFDNVTTPERDTNDYQTPKPIWGASARSKRDIEDDAVSVSSAETDTRFVVWEAPTCLREIRKSEANSPLQPTMTAHEILRKSFFRNVLVPLQETLSRSSGDMVWAITKTGQLELKKPARLPECSRLPDFRDDDPTEKSSSNATLIAFKEFCSDLQDVEILWGINADKLFCTSVLPFRQFQALLARRSLKAVITRCGVHLCQSRAGSNDATSSLVRRVMHWVSTFVGPCLTSDFYPLGRHGDTETELDSLCFSIRSELGASSRIEIKKLLRRFNSILCVEKENAQALTECQDLELLFAQFDPPEVDVSD